MFLFQFQAETVLTNLLNAKFIAIVSSKIHVMKMSICPTYIHSASLIVTHTHIRIAWSPIHEITLHFLVYKQ